MRNCLLRILKEPIWEAVTAIVTIIATIVAIIVYYSQTSLMVSTLLSTQGGVEAQFYASIQNAMNELYKNQAVYDYYRSMLKPAPFGASLDYQEIRNYLDMLEITASLHDTGKVNKDNFVNLYSGKIKEAAKFVENVIKTQRYGEHVYENIVKLAQDLESKKTFSLKWSYVWAGFLVISLIFYIRLYCALCRLKRTKMRCSAWCCWKHCPHKISACHHPHHPKNHPLRSSPSITP